MLLAACATPFAGASKPADELAASLRAMASLKTARADYQRQLIEHFPSGYSDPAIAGQLPDPLIANLTGTGLVEFPDRFRYTISVRGASSDAIRQELISIGDVTYVTNNLYGRPEFGSNARYHWVKTKHPGRLLPVNPFKTLALLAQMTRVDDLGDTTLDGLRVHHYRAGANKTTLAAQQFKSVSDPSLQPAIRDAVDNETFDVQVWIGVDDHLIRQISEQIHIKETVGLLNADLELPAPSAAESTQTVDTRSSFVLTFKGFNSAVSITTPASIDVLPGR